MSISLRHEEMIAVLDLGDDENRFSPGFLDEINSHLHDVVRGTAKIVVDTQ